MRPVCPALRYVSSAKNTKFSRKHRASSSSKCACRHSNFSSTPYAFIVFSLVVGLSSVDCGRISAAVAAVITTGANADGAVHFSARKLIHLHCHTWAIFWLLEVNVCAVNLEMFRRRSRLVAIARPNPRHGTTADRMWWMNSVGVVCLCVWSGWLPIGNQPGRRVATRSSDTWRNGASRRGKMC